MKFCGTAGHCRRSAEAPRCSSLDRVGHGGAAERHAAAHNARRLARRDGGIEHAAAGLAAELNPAIIAAARRLAGDPEAAQLPLLLADREQVVGEALEDAVQRPAPKSLLVGVELVRGRRVAAVLGRAALQVTEAPQRPAANARGVVRGVLCAGQAAAALREDSDATILIVARSELDSPSEAADLASAKAAGEIHTVNAATAVAAVDAPSRLPQDPVLQRVASSHKGTARQLLLGGVWHHVRHL